MRVEAITRAAFVFNGAEHAPALNQRVPAAALTAYARSEDRVKVLEAGYQTHVTKPVDPSELIAVVASLAGRAGRGIRASRAES